MNAKDFRRKAKESLKGNWLTAVLVGIVASLLGAIGDMGPEVNFEYKGSVPSVNFAIAGQTLFSTGGSIDSGIGALLAGGAVVLALVSLVLAVITFILGSVLEIGYGKFNLNLIDRQDIAFDNLFAYFSYWKTALASRFLRFLYVLLWSLLFVIPGIIADYRYAMTGYILAENPDMTAGEAIDLSKRLMKGKKWRLFCLRFSFIGWDILAGLTLGIGYIWLTPYKEAAEAAFYREISGTGHKNEETNWESFAGNFYE